MDDSCIDYANASLRGKKKVYEFVGGPEYQKDTASRVIKKESDVKEHVESETQSASNSTILDILPLLASSSPSELPVITTTEPNKYIVGPDLPFQPEIGRARVPYVPAKTTKYVAGPTDGSLKPLGMASNAMQGLPYFDIPAAAFRSYPRPRSGDLAARLGITIKRKQVTEVLPMMGPIVPRTLPDSPPKKRKRAGPFAFSSCPGGSGLLAPRKSTKKIKVEESDEDLVESELLPVKEHNEEQVEQEPCEENSTSDLDPEPAPKKVRIDFEERAQAVIQQGRIADLMFV